MFIAKIENKNKEVLQITQNNNYSIDNITGLNPVNATINTIEIFGMDGASYNSSKAGIRNIVITLVIESPAEENRINLYRHIAPKEEVTFYYKNTKRDVKILGYIESMENNLFENKQKVQISILCVNPYFINTKETVIDISKIEKKFTFPFVIENEVELSRFEEDAKIYIKNEGDIENGFTISVYANGVVKNIVINNIATKKWIAVDLELKTGDRLDICTEKGKKAIYLYRNNQKYNKINKVVEGSSWITCQKGNNKFDFTCEKGTENATVQIKFNSKVVGM